jgi:hypothetical protein
MTPVSFVPFFYQRQSLSSQIRFFAQRGKGIKQNRKGRDTQQFLHFEAFPL